MNSAELSKNPVLTDWDVKVLNFVVEVPAMFVAAPPRYMLTIRIC